MSVGPAVPTSLDFAEPVPPEVPVGADVTFRVKVTSAAGSDLRGGRVDVVAADEAVATAALLASRGGCNETDAFTARAPDCVGTFSWIVRFPAQEIGGVAYGESALPIASQTRPHRTSLAIWAVPSPVRIADRFAITVGAKSSGACVLAGAAVAVLDETGAKVGSSVLGDTPWPGTAALYWSEIALTAPSQHGVSYWSAMFAADALKLPHLGSSGEFSFAVVKRPEHSVTIKVVERGGAAPIEDVQVALGPYRAATDRDGSARIETPAGTYELAVWKSGFEAAPKSVEIAADLAVQVELTRLAEEVKAWG